MQVTLAQIHIVLVPQDGGVDLNAKDVRAAHYQGILSASYEPCALGRPNDWWFRDTFIAKVAAAVRSCLKKEGRAEVSCRNNHTEPMPVRVPFNPLESGPAEY